MEKTVTAIISAGELSVSLSVSGGVLLTAIEDKKSGVRFLNSAHALFSLTARRVENDETVTVGSDAGWGKAVYENVGNEHIFVLTENDALPRVTAVVCAHAENGKIAWSTRLISENDEYSLYECDHPAIYFDCVPQRSFLSPTGPGEVWNSLQECRSCQNYPSYGASMQFMAFWDNDIRRGIYYGLHDPSPAYKKIFFEKKKHDDFFTAKISQPLTDIDVGCNSQTLYGECVWQIFDGNWYDAALIYRKFFLDYAVWKPETEHGSRADTPEWFKKVSHWWRVRMKDDEQYVDDILRANADLGYDSPVHLYDWFKIPYDNDYPHYFPAKEAMYTGVKRLQESGVRVMPYINARLWDTRDKGMEDFEWSEKAYPNCTKDKTGKPFIEIYSSKEADGSPVRHSIMCPSTACWQETITAVVDKLLNEVGVNAVYMDQIAAAQPYPCEDRTHSHRPGGGSWWVEGYNNLLDHVNRIRPSEAALSTECTADPFMKHMQGYLTWIWVHNAQVPAFVAIYAGYVTMLGRNYCFMPVEDDEGQRIMIAQSLTFGEQLGWNDPLLYLQMKHRDFYRRCVAAREEIGSFMYEGTLLRSPEFTCDAPILRTTQCREAYGGLVEHSVIFCEHWQRFDGKRMLLLVNAGESECEARCVRSLDDGEYALAGDCSAVLKIENGNGSVKLPPLSVQYCIY